MYISKKIKSLLGALLFLLIIHSADAKSVRDDFYVGLGFVDSINHFDLKAQNPATGISVERKKDHNNLLGSAFLGYGYTASCSFYVAAELGTYFPSRLTKITRPGVSLTAFTYVNQISIQDYLTGDILLGFRPIDCVLLYLRGGASYTNIELHQFANALANTPSFNTEKNKAGGRAGIGINYGFTRHWGLGLDYIFTYYQNLHAFWSLTNIHFEEKTYAHYIGLSALYSF
ncbi:MAG: outer membrane beta-barrel protein [Chlamydiae bacterium]|nr:outer membrane beta-barrel protein [Chlamydiota bacterium]